MSDFSPVPLERIDGSILLMRGQKVVLDYDLAKMYGVETRILNRVVKRNLARFPSDFMFQLTKPMLRGRQDFVGPDLVSGRAHGGGHTGNSRPDARSGPTRCVTSVTKDEAEVILKCQIGASSDEKSRNPLSDKANLISQIGTSSLSEWGGRRKPIYAFTEQGVAMLSGLLNSPRAIAVNIEIMRAFVRLRQLISTSADLARKLAALEKKYDAQFKIVFDAIRELMTPITPADKKREIGFHTALKPSPSPTNKPASKSKKLPTPAPA
jgi:hypothetical protein